MKRKRFWNCSLDICGNDKNTIRYSSNLLFTLKWTVMDSLQCQYKHQFISMLEERGLYKKEEKKEENVDD
jgi:hypothetical protein